MRKVHKLPIKNKLVYGVGLNDADYKVAPRIDGKLVACEFYTTWANMLKRCYHAGSKQQCGGVYDGVTVCDEWKTFSTFKAWMEKQDWRGKDLDKDIISNDDKTYSPETCCFISHSVNTLLVDSRATRGDCPQGVCRARGKFLAQISVGTVRKFLGYYETMEGASKAYIIAKIGHIKTLASQQNDSRISTGLLKHAAKLEDGMCGGAA